MSAWRRSSLFAPSAHGAADFIDARLAVLLAYLAFASLRGPSGSAGKTGAAVLAVALVVARVGLAAPHWAQYDGWAAAFRDAIRAVPPGARVLAVAPPAGLCPSLDAADFYRGLVNFVVIDRRALASTLFTGRGMQPAAARDPRLDATPWTPPHPDWLASHDWRALYDTLIALHVDCDWRPQESDLVPVGANAASDDLPPALTPDLAELAIRIMSGRFQSRSGDGRRREE